MPNFNGVVEIQDGGNAPTIVLDGNNGDVTVGGSSQDGQLLVGSGAGVARVSIDGATGTVMIKAADGDPIVTIDGTQGDIVVHRKVAGINREIFNFDASTATLKIGGDTNEGDVVVRDGLNRERITLDGGEGDIIVRDVNGVPWFHFDSQFAALFLGGRGNEGDLVVRDEANRERIKLDGGEGDIIVRDTAGTALFHFDSEFAALFLGGSGNEGDLVVRNGDGNQTIKLDGGQGDIILNNADAAEDFAVARAEDATPGMVMVLVDDGTLEPCSRAYDRKVVGVVSGAGPYKPGLVFDRGEAKDPLRAPISMMGKVACRADAAYGRIEVGDLLTTSPRPGCAMKATDPGRAFGAVIGKAMSPLDDGEGLVTMLISLQ